MAFLVQQKAVVLIQEDHLHCSVASQTEPVLHVITTSRRIRFGDVSTESDILAFLTSSPSERGAHVGYTRSNNGKLSSNPHYDQSIALHVKLLTCLVQRRLLQ